MEMKKFPRSRLNRFGFSHVLISHGFVRRPLAMKHTFGMEQSGSFAAAALFCPLAEKIHPKSKNFGLTCKQKAQNRGIVRPPTP
ncbi:MAG: hypothetical protein LIO42_05735 [Oscillospiraceae bacterium]|nr:hypothetical protein [Oscillospiraceae bacterium]